MPGAPDPDASTSEPTGACPTALPLAGLSTAAIVAAWDDIISMDR